VKLYKVLRRFAAAVEKLGKILHQGGTTEVYEMFVQVLKQIGTISC
jgi:hypothetical protein